MPRSTRYFFTEAARFWDSWRLYSSVPRSSACPASSIRPDPAALMHWARSLRRLWASAGSVASLKPKRSGSQLHSDFVAAATHLFCWHSWPPAQSALSLQEPGGSTQRPFWHSWAPPHWLLEVHCGAAHLPPWQICPPVHCSSREPSGPLGTHLLPWHAKPSLQLASAAHSWHVPLTQTSPFSWQVSSLLPLGEGGGAAGGTATARGSPATTEMPRLG